MCTWLCFESVNQVADLAVATFDSDYGTPFNIVYSRLRWFDPAQGSVVPFGDVVTYAARTLAALLPDRTPVELVESIPWHFSALRLETTPSQIAINPRVAEVKAYVESLHAVGWGYVLGSMRLDFSSSSWVRDATYYAPVEMHIVHPSRETSSAYLMQFIPTTRPDLQPHDVEVKWIR